MVLTPVTTPAGAGCFPKTSDTRGVIPFAVVTLRTAFDGSTGTRSVAGASARQEAARRRQEAERLLLDVELLERAADGEERTAATLAWLPPAFVTVHDLRLPGSQSNVDHLVVGPTGVFVIDTKVHDGVVRYGSGTLWRGDRSMRAELHALAFEATRLAAVLDAATTAVACFADGDLPRRELTFDGVRVLPLAALVSFVVDRATVVAPHDVERLTQEARRLARRTTRASLTTSPAPAPAAASAPAPVLPAGHQRRAALSAPGDGLLTGPTTSPDEPAAPGPVASAASTDGRVAAPHRARTNRRTMVLVAGGLALTGALSFAVGVVLRDRTTASAGAPGGAAAATSAAPAAAPGAGPTGVALAVSCPDPGLGWTVTPLWPGQPDGTAGYDVSWRAADGPTWIPAGRWSAADQGPPTTLGNLPPGTGVAVRLVARDAQQRTTGERIGAATTPATPC